MDSRYKIPALPRYLKDSDDTVEEENPGRGKTGAERDSEKNQVTKSQESHWREKSEDIESRYPYRKPTQVDEERILRRAREVLLRNSAN